MAEEVPRNRIAVFSGPNATITNTPTLVTGNKGRLPGERLLPGRFDHLVPQELYEPVVVKIKRFSAHPLEDDAAAVYHEPSRDYYEVELYEVELRPEDGPYLLPYVARRADGSLHGVPFEVFGRPRVFSFLVFRKMPCRPLGGTELVTDRRVRFGGDHVSPPEVDSIDAEAARKKAAIDGKTDAPWQGGCTDTTAGTS